ncbi:MAG: hypothetical protein O2954_18775, partial [bacterium]|nr:hypothetical protein [bacterium]
GKEKKFFGGRVRRVPQVKDTETTIRVAVVNFSGFESQKAGEHLAELIKMNLNRFGHIRLVEVGTGAEYLDPDAAMRLAQMSNADVVITGRVLRYEINRTSRPNLPLVVGFPQTVATVEADVRVVDPRGQKEPLSLRILGTGRNARGVHLFPTSTDDRTSYLSVIERERIWDEAGQQVVGDLLTEMSQTFKWLPQ